MAPRLLPRLSRTLLNFSFRSGGRGRLAAADPPRQLSHSPSEADLLANTAYTKFAKDQTVSVTSLAKNDQRLPATTKFAQDPAEIAAFSANNDHRRTAKTKFATKQTVPVTSLAKNDQRLPTRQIR